MSYRRLRRAASSSTLYWGGRGGRGPHERVQAGIPQILLAKYCPRSVVPAPPSARRPSAVLPSTTGSWPARPANSVQLTRHELRFLPSLLLLSRFLAFRPSCVSPCAKDGSLYPRRPATTRSTGHLLVQSGAAQVAKVKSRPRVNLPCRYDRLRFPALKKRHAGREGTPGRRIATEDIFRAHTDTLGVWRACSLLRRWPCAVAAGQLPRRAHRMAAGQTRPRLTSRWAPRRRGAPRNKDHRPGSASGCRWGRQRRTPADA